MPLSRLRALSSKGGACASSALPLRQRRRGRAEELRPEVVLVDITLGPESGFDLARRLSGHDRGGGAAVILISTYAEADFADLIADNPATGFLSKGELSAHAIRRIADGGGPAGPPGARAR